MKISIIVRAIIALASFSIGGALLADGSVSPVTISSISVSNSQVVLTWSGGRPTYQVQTRSSLAGNWANLDAPTSNSVAVIPIDSAQAFFRVISDFTARYQVAFNATWSQATLPTNWPGE